MGAHIPNTSYLPTINWNQARSVSFQNYLQEVIMCLNNGQLLLHTMHCFLLLIVKCNLSNVLYTRRDTSSLAHLKLFLHIAFLLLISHETEVITTYPNKEYLLIGKCNFELKFYWLTPKYEIYCIHSCKFACCIFFFIESQKITKSAKPSRFNIFLMSSYVNLSCYVRGFMEHIPSSE